MRGFMHGQAARACTTGFKKRLTDLGQCNSILLSEQCPIIVGALITLVTSMQAEVS